MRSLFRNFLGGLAGSLIGGFMIGLVFGAGLPLPGSTGPSLGDPTTNLWSLTRAYTMGRDLASSSALSVSQTATQGACTQLAQIAQYALVNITTSAGTGSICLPTAVSGRWQVIFNNTGQTIDIFGSATTFTPGTQDTINNVTGSTAYTGLTTRKTALCFAIANGVWSCGSIS